MFRQLVPLTAALPSGTWDDLDKLAHQLQDLALLPVIGAGASIDCGSPTSASLAAGLLDDVRKGTIPMSKRPSDLGSLKKDLGKMADAICLEQSQR